MKWAERGLIIWALLLICIGLVIYISLHRQEGFQNRPMPNELGANKAVSLTDACNQLKNLRGQLTTVVKNLRDKMSDKNGLRYTNTVSIAVKEENIELQYEVVDDCKTSLLRKNPTNIQKEQRKACLDMASQDTLIVNNILPQYDMTNQTLYEQEAYISATLDTVNDTIKLLRCDISGFEYSVDNDVGTIDTEQLRATLNTLSPYYISGATLDFITAYLVGTGLLGAVSSASDIFSNTYATVGQVNTITKAMTW